MILILDMFLHELQEKDRVKDNLITVTIAQSHFIVSDEDGRGRGVMGREFLQYCLQWTCVALIRCVLGSHEGVYF